MKDKRPVNLDLTKFHFPVMAIVSILHRIAGVLLFLAIPFLLYLLDQSLTNAHTFNMLLTNSWNKFFLWVALAALGYHLAAGVRHLLMDFGCGDHLPGAYKVAWTTIVVAVILIILAGVWVW